MSDKGGLQLIPETRRKIEVSVPGENRMLYWGIGFLLVVGLAYGGLFAYASSLEQQLADINTQIDEQEKTRNAKHEVEIMTLSNQVKLVSDALKGHTLPTKGLNKLKELLLPEVSLKSMEVNLVKDEVSLIAKASNHALIAKQIKAFVTDDAIKDLAPTGIKIVGGGLEFSFVIKVDALKFIK